MAADITDAATSLTLTAGSSFPAGGSAPFVIVIDRGAAAEEKVLCASRASNVITVQQRGYDGSTAQAHTAPATVDHVLDAYTIEQANALASAMTAEHDLVRRGASGVAFERVAIGTDGMLLTVVAGVPAWAAPSVAPARIGGSWSMSTVSLPNAATTTLVFDTEIADPDGFYPGSGTTFTIPAGLGGVYAVNCTLTGPAGWVDSGLYTATVNASTGERAQFAGSGVDAVGDAMAVWVMAAGASITVPVFNLSGSSQNFSAKFRLYRISQ